jgi:hypothetical protein
MFMERLWNCWQKEGAGSQGFASGLPSLESHFCQNLDVLPLGKKHDCYANSWYKFETW